MIHIRINIFHFHFRFLIFETFVRFSHTSVQNECIKINGCKQCNAAIGTNYKQFVSKCQLVKIWNLINKRWSLSRAEPTRTSVGLHLLCIWVSQSGRGREVPVVSQFGWRDFHIWDRVAKFVLRNLCVLCISFTFEKHFLCFDTRILNIHHADVNISFSIETFLAIASDTKNTSKYSHDSLW